MRDTDDFVVSPGMNSDMRCLLRRQDEITDVGVWRLRPAEIPLLFICGLHRSGTSILARLLGSAPGTHAMTCTGVPEDEGQHLQDVFAPASVYGGPGLFALNPGSHLTENSELATADNAHAILRAWVPHWHLPEGQRLRWGAQPGTAVVLEKSPPNLVRTRFLQKLFPRARFVVLRRHPAVVAASTQKMCPDRDVTTLLQHWLVAHNQYDVDAPHLAVVHELRYEDLLADPGTSLRRLAEAVGIDRRFNRSLLEPGRTGLHLRTWQRISAAIPPGDLYQVEAKIHRYGYSLTEPYDIRPVRSIGHVAPQPTGSCRVTPRGRP